VNQPNAVFPSGTLCRLARRLDAIVQYHNAGVGYAREDERLLGVAIMEIETTLKALRPTAQERGAEFQAIEESVRCDPCLGSL
jgi:hypothetical protein